MNPQMLFNPLEMFFVMLFGGGFGMLTAVPPTQPDVVAAHVAPAECLFYTSWAGTGEPDPSSANHTEQLLAEPEVQKFLSGGIGQLSKMLKTVGIGRQNDPQAKLLFDDALKLAELIQGKPGAVYLSSFKFNGRDASTFRGGGLIRVDDDANAVKELLLQIQERVSGEKVTSVDVAGHTLWTPFIADYAPPISW